MADEFNLVLELLRQMRVDIARLLEEQQAQGRRLASVERHLANLHNDVTEHRADLKSLKSRVERIERRLELHDAGA